MPQQLSVPSVKKQSIWFSHLSIEECDDNVKKISSPYLFILTLKLMDSDANNRIILGIDPGTSVMGYGVVSITDKTISLVSAGVVRLEKIKDHALKLSKIFKECQHYCHQGVLT